MDRGYAKYDLLQQILDHDSSFVNRIRDNYVGEVIEERPVSAEGQAASIVRDRLLHLGSDPRRRDLVEPVRVIEVQCPRSPRWRGFLGLRCHNRKQSRLIPIL
jgi:hypothetical protein